jgi:hypothetical protein
MSTPTAAGMIAPPVHLDEMVPGAKRSQVIDPLHMGSAWRTSR